MPIRCVGVPDLSAIDNMTAIEKQKRYRDRANRNWRALRKEQEQFGYISDGGGKRYLAGIYYVLAGEQEKSNAYFTWFESEFPEDVGDPMFLLCWAIAARQSGPEEQARRRFHLAMLSNLYLVPQLIGEPIAEINMWHSSSWHQSDYLFDVEEWLSDIPTELVPWLAAEYHTTDAAQLRGEYIKTFRALQSEKAVSQRKNILQTWYDYSESKLGKIG